MRKLALLFLLTGWLLQGCVALVAAGAGAGAGAGAVAYVRGELQTTYPVSLDRTWDAVLGALNELAIPVKSAKKNALGGSIEATRADGTAVRVALESAGPGATAVRIRVGMLGDEEASKAIHQKIAERLGTKPG